MPKNATTAQLSFALRSTVYRLLRMDTPRIDVDQPVLNLGCGQAYVPGMVNADFFPRFSRTGRPARLEWYLDLRYPLNCPEGVFSGVFCEHTLEHLTPDHGTCCGSCSASCSRGRSSGSPFLTLRSTYSSICTAQTV
jgi:hypothetical protein